MKEKRINNTFIVKRKSEQFRLELSKKQKSPLRQYPKINLFKHSNHFSFSFAARAFLSTLLAALYVFFLLPSCELNEARKLSERE